MTTDGVSKQEYVYDAIRRRILDGVYAPGYRLVIDALADDLGVSAAPVREAIRRLEAEGRVVHRHNAGSRVAPVEGRRALRVGIDVGRGSVDAVLLDGANVMVAVKVPATGVVTDGVAAALEAVLRDGRVAASAIAAVVVGTGHFADAFVERRIEPAACIRLGLPATTALPPMVDWPDAARAAVAVRCYLAHGGHEVDGRPLSRLDEAELRSIAADLSAHGVKAIAVSAVFSPLVSTAEQRAAAILRAAAPGVEVTLSHQVGGLGLLARENAAIINACVQAYARTTIAALRRALTRLGLTAPLYLTQNDGALMTSHAAEQHPVLTFGAGKANGIRGAAALSGLQDGVVIDVGGTTTEVGVLIHGFPRETEEPTLIGGVRTNIRVPDVRSLPFGGGSIVTANPWRVGPASVGSSLRTDALIFGGQTITLTDIAVAAGAANIGEARLAAALARDASTVLDLVGPLVRSAVDRARGGNSDTPVIIVGGGAPLLRTLLSDTPLIPAHHTAAKAVGAATAPVAGRIDRIVSLDGVSQREVMASAVSDAVSRAIMSGADAGTVRIVSTEDAPLAYLPGNFIRVRVKAIGAPVAENARAR